MDADFCVTALEEAIAGFGRTRDLQYRSRFADLQLGFHGRREGANIRISIDGRRRWMDDVSSSDMWRSLKYRVIDWRLSASRATLPSWTTSWRVTKGWRYG